MEIPAQSPLHHSLHKDRYARQQRIQEIEQATKRTLIVYVANASHPGGLINRDDILPFGDLLMRKQNLNLDLLLQSPGGDIDKAEKIVYMCRKQAMSFRVIVPESARSAATLIALAADSIVIRLGLNVEYLDPEDNLWKALWQLYCDYELELRTKRLVKIFESAEISLTLT